MKTFEITYAVKNWLYRTNIQATSEANAIDRWYQQHDSSVEIREVRLIEDHEE